MLTDNGTEWAVQNNAIIIYHQQEEAPLWLSKEDIEAMLNQWNGEDQ